MGVTGRFSRSRSSELDVRQNNLTVTFVHDFGPARAFFTCAGTDASSEWAVEVGLPAGGAIISGHAESTENVGARARCVIGRAVPKYRNQEYAALRERFREALRAAGTKGARGAAFGHVTGRRCDPAQCASERRPTSWTACLRLAADPRSTWTPWVERPFVGDRWRHPAAARISPLR